MQGIDPRTSNEKIECVPTFALMNGDFRSLSFIYTAASSFEQIATFVFQFNLKKVPVEFYFLNNTV